MKSHIASYPEIENHPRTLRIRREMGWDIDTTIGRLHRFWWWCLKYAKKGWVDKFGTTPFEDLFDIDPPEAAAFLAAMVNAGWVRLVEGRHMLSDWPPLQTDKMKHQAKDQKHRRRSQTKGGRVTSSDWREVCSYYGDRCAYCLKPLDEPHMDHIDPLARGGQHIPLNVAPACPACNSRKWMRTPLEFAAFDNGITISVN
jgi:hypothetical protein